MPPYKTSYSHSKYGKSDSATGMKQSAMQPLESFILLW